MLCGRVGCLPSPVARRVNSTAMKSAPISARPKASASGRSATRSPVVRSRKFSFATWALAALGEQERGGAGQSGFFISSL